VLRRLHGDEQGRIAGEQAVRTVLRDGLWLDAAEGVGNAESEGETMKWSLWRLVVALTIAAVLVLAARYFGWSHIPITVE
jgi:hypothetical protein